MRWNLSIVCLVLVLYLYYFVPFCSFSEKGVGGSAEECKRCQAVSRLIATCPSQAASVEEYYNCVCPQVSRAVSYS